MAEAVRLADRPRDVAPPLAAPSRDGFVDLNESAAALLAAGYDLAEEFTSDFSHGPRAP